MLNYIFYLLFGERKQLMVTIALKIEQRKPLREISIMLQCRYTEFTHLVLSTTNIHRLRTLLNSLCICYK